MLSNPSPLYEITVDDINRLGEEAFIDFVNRLLQAEGQRAGIPPISIQTSMRKNDPDEGVDALVNDAPAGLAWIPEGNSVWQFKKSDISPGQVKTEEFPKPGVQKAVHGGGAYCLVIGADITSTKTKHRQDALTECFNQQQLPSRGGLFTASHLAQWASEHPSMALLPHFSRPTHSDFTRWEVWSNQERFRAPFKSDQQRDTTITEVRQHLSGQSDRLHFRIEGLAGIGKTRLALECCRQVGLQERVLYAESPSNIPPGLFLWLESRANTSAIIVVDECSRDEAEKFTHQVERCNGRVRLLTIGLSQEVYSSYQTYPGVFLLDKLDDEAMQLLLHSVFPKQPLESILFTVRVSSGYVKLATAIATAIDRNPAIVSIQDLTGSYDVNLVLSKFIVPDETNRRIMQGIALLTRVGWDGELGRQGQVIMAFLGLNNWPDVRMRVGQLVREGLIAKQGCQLSDGAAQLIFGHEPSLFSAKQPSLTACQKP
ncbi:MAG: hypothetical protein MN733_41240, partial [Nitrososphaera sp.]|nr:hypothetical protein [Nitrososphaera sp.]